MFEVLRNKDLRKTYFDGFLNGFNSAANFWRPVKFEEKSLDEMNRESMDRAWIQTGQGLREACLSVEKKYGLSHE
ncbi:MAG: hypothetical protein LBS34_02795 [Rickettsiales bacterium]|jgi:hypothetical protein|nr:hypothetical protein [Rickettsiales bacterium]